MSSIDRRRIAVVLFVACLAGAFGESGSTLQAQSPDAAVLHALKQTDRSLVAARIWHRVPLENGHDLVLALGATQSDYLYPETGEWTVWPIQKLGLFLQDRMQPGRVFALTVAAGPPDCLARVLRATITDTVIACLGEKSEIHPSQKFVYDVRAKRLVSRVEYGPFDDFRIQRTTAYRARLTASSDTQQVTIDFFSDTSEFRIVGANPRAEPDSYRMRSTPTFRSSSHSFGAARAFRLVEGDYDPDCAFPRVVVVETGKRRQRQHAMPPSYCDRIGPWAIEGDRLWFGKAFYSGECNKGIGGVGYFDTVTRKFEIVLPPEIRDFSSTAILVQPDAIWLALAVHGEYHSAGQGIVRHDRRTNTLTRFDIGDSIGHAFVALGDRILLAADNGVVVIQDGSVRRYIVDKTTDGRLRVAEAFK